MWSSFWCCGFAPNGPDDIETGEREPLLQPEEETPRQEQLHDDLYAFQIIRALSMGYMPSSDQFVSRLRAFLASDALNLHLHQGRRHGQASASLSSSGQTLVQLTRQFLEQLIVLVEDKNSGDEIQDFVWYLSKADLSVDVDGVARKAKQATRSAQTAAVNQSLQTVASLLLANPDVRGLMSDLVDVGRDIFRDTAVSLSQASQEAADNVAAAAPTNGKAGEDDAHGDGESESSEAPQPQDQLADMAAQVKDGAVKVAKDAKESVSDRLIEDGDGTRTRLLSRLQKAVLALQKRPDYADAVSTLSTILQRYAEAYLRVAEQAVEEVVGEGETVQTNDEADLALRNFAAFLSSFGDAAAWAELNERFHRLLARTADDGQQLDGLVRQVGRTLQAMLTDPEFFDDPESHLSDIQRRVGDLSQPSSQPDGTSLQDDLDAVLSQLQVTLQSVRDDSAVAQLLKTSGRIVDVLWPADRTGGNADLLDDAVHVLAPLAIQAVRCIPIPRLEVATPDADVLLESLVLRPGETMSLADVSVASFLPYRLRAQMRNNVDVRQARFGVASSMASTASIKVDGFSVAFEDMGYVLRLHNWSSWLGSTIEDSGLLSVRLDQGGGVDVHLDVELVRDRADTMVALRSVDVKIHRLDYSIRRSRRLACLSWFPFRVLLRPLLRRNFQRQLAYSIREGLHTLNRELVFARERLRAARVASQPGDLVSLLRAVAARYAPTDDDPDRQVRISGFSSWLSGSSAQTSEVFSGVYAPGSLVEVWDQEALQASTRIDEHRRDGWRNDIFDVSGV